MTSGYTPLNRFLLQEDGSNVNVWGAKLNGSVFGLLDLALDGMAVISSGGSVVLTTALGEDDQARRRALLISSPSQAVVTIPSVSKLYLVIATVADHIITNGADSVTVHAGDVAWVVTDGASIWQGPRLKNLPPPVRDGDAATRKFVSDAILASASADFPTMPGSGCRYLLARAGETGPEWEPEEIALAGDHLASVGERLACNTASGPFTVTLPSSPSEGDWIALRDAGNTDEDGGWSDEPVTVDGAGHDINGDSELVCDAKGAAITLRFMSGQWSVKLG